MSKHSHYVKKIAIGAVVLLGLAGCNQGNTTAGSGNAPTNDTTAPSSTAPVNSTSTNVSQSNTPLNADRAEGAIENALEADTKLRAFDLDADDNNGAIALKGTVQTTEERALAEEIAKRTAPGISINNQIRVAATGSTRLSQIGKPPANADEAENLVSNAFEADATLKPLDIEADEANGKGILLKGTVQTADQKTLAENIAKQVAPGFSINNQIRVVQ